MQHLITLTGTFKKVTSCTVFNTILPIIKTIPVKIFKRKFHVNGNDIKHITRKTLAIKLRNINYKSFGFVLTF